jgi:ABC-type transport system involved in multi-copper enzyme maturation permease subunit
MIDLLMSEMRRALHRRVVWMLIALALLGVAALGVVAFVDSAGKSLADLGRDGEHPAVMVNWWTAGGGDGILMIAALPLLIGAVLGGASVLGGEWRAGTMTTVLTWEPRRLRVHAIRLTSAFVLAVIIAFVLETLFLLAALPAVLAHGSTAGTDGGWWIALLGAMVRIALMTGGAAVLAGSLATIGRGTTFALGAVFGWIAIAESLIRGLKPSLEPHLLGENLSIVLTWAPLSGVDFTREAPLALAALVGYFAVIAAACAASFVRRDVVGAS